MTLSSLFNIKGLAIAFALGFAVGGGSGYILAVGQFEKVALAAAPKAAKAQHDQDVKQHGVAVQASATASAGAAKTTANTGEQVRVVHDIRTIFRDVPALCPDDPEIAPEILNAYNKAGH